MKKVISLMFLLLINTSVLACGEIKNVRVSDGIVTKIGDYEYSIRIKEDTTKVTIFAETDYDWIEGYAPRTVSVNNPVELIVDGYKCGYGRYNYKFKFETLSTIAENIEETTTTITETNDSGIVLSDLMITGYDIGFKSNIFVYNLEVEYDVTALEIIPTKDIESDTVNVSSNATNLVEGLNAIKVQVLSSDGTSATYTINVTRKQKPSSNNYLASLQIVGYQLSFDPATFEYTVDINNEKDLTVKATPEDKNAKVTISGNTNIKTSGTVIVTVTASNKEERVYTVHIKRTFNIMNYWQYIAVAGGIILLIILLVITRKKKNKPKKEKKQETGPNTITNETQTVGPAPVKEEVKEEQPVETLTNVELKIVEPTDVGETQEVSETTEVFKL